MTARPPITLAATTDGAVLLVCGCGFELRLGAEPQPIDVCHEAELHRRLSHPAQPDGLPAALDHRDVGNTRRGW